MSTSTPVSAAASVIASHHALYQRGGLGVVAAARLGAQHAALGDDVRGRAAGDDADVGRRLVVDTALLAARRWPAPRPGRRCGRPPGAMPACAATPRNSAVTSLCVGARDDHAARLAGAVEDEHDLGAQSREVEALAPRRPISSRDGEQDLDVRRRRLVRRGRAGAAGAPPQRPCRRRPGWSRPSVRTMPFSQITGATRSERHGVEVRAERDGQPSPRPGHADEEVAGAARADGAAASSSGHQAQSRARTP